MGDRPLLLDLFCGAGGAAVGYHRAGFDIIGVDIDPAQLAQYPFPCVRADALDLPFSLDAFDVIHASPPCQRYSNSTAGTGRRENHPDLVDPVRDMLAGRLYVIENVPGSPVRPDMTLCGSMFGLQIQRHRVFELGGWWTMQHGCTGHDYDPVDVTGHAGGHRQTLRPGYPLKYRDTAHARALMGMPWATSRGVTEAIPPAYTEHIGAQLLEVIDHAPAAG
jgi:DNA (cytosine-5)-methyltransferase 1